MKFLLSTLCILFLITPTLGEIKEFDSDKVLVDTDLGQVIYVPREIDYDYHKSTTKLDKEYRPSLKDLILGRKPCGCSN
jgi:hypothetical protein